MGSSPTEELVQEIAGAYEVALAALHGTDLEAVQGHLDQVDQLTRELQKQEPLGVVDPSGLGRCRSSTPSFALSSKPPRPA